MACEIISTRGAVFSLWGKPSPRDMDMVAEALDAAAQACGHPVVYITRVPVSAPPPNAEARATLDRLMPKLLPLFSSYHVVLEGVGFGSALKRGILVGLFQLSWRRKTFFVHSEVNEIPFILPKEQRTAVHDLIGAALCKGLLSAPPPVSLRPTRFGRSSHAA